MPALVFVAVGICIWRCRKKGAQAPDMFLGAFALLALGLVIDLQAIATPINGAMTQIFDSAKNAF